MPVRLYAFLVAIILVILIIGVFLMPMLNLSRDTDEKAMAELRRVIEKAVVQCYALEGSYPPNLEYLQEVYGIELDHYKYVYVYEPNAMSNIKPEIDVLPNLYERWYGR